MIGVIARGALSGLGEGELASGVAPVGEAAKVAITKDAELESSGLARPLAARAKVDAGNDDRATVLLARAFALLAKELDVVRPGWKSERIGLALATSSGGMRSAETFFDRLASGDPIPREVAAKATYFAPMVDAITATKLAFAPATLVLTACAASTLAIGIGTRWLEAGECDLVIAGGFDAVSVFVASGFEVLRATTAEIPPKPFCEGRDGMSLGEAAGLVALAKNPEAARGWIAGFGASSDAVHLTAPDRTGDGLRRAATAALENAGIAAAKVDLVSPHATATPFNDAAEMKALANVLGDRRPTILPLKAQLGHTLGAAGVIETLSCLDAMERSIVPASAAKGAVEADLPAVLRRASEEGSVEVALKMSAAFGGANASLVLTRAPALAPRASHVVHASRGALVRDLPDAAQLAARTGMPADKIARGDGLVRYALGAVAALEDAVGSLKGAGVVVGHSIATLETNYLYHARIREKGPKQGEPRRFPYTSPNAVAGECGVAFGLTGPGLAVASGLHGGLEALAIGFALVRAGDAERVVVVAVDEIGEAARALASAAGYGELTSGAVALLLSRDPSGYAIVESANAFFESGVFANVSLPGHLALATLCESDPPLAISASSPWGGVRAKLTRVASRG
ncbi:MAG TPA: beta-ketoacyl synthase N-terminal-like domain-containing protein [Polyangiaceae bacterium]